MKRLITSILLFSTIFTFSSCGKIGDESVTENNQQAESATYVMISQSEAKKIIEESDDFIIVDAREQYEYEEGHIEGAICISHEEIGEKAEKLLPDKDKLILIYCRSGRRSKLAAQTLSDLGYTNVKEFGGIIDWEYETVKEKTTA